MNAGFAAAQPNYWSFSRSAAPNQTLFLASDDDAESEESTDTTSKKKTKKLPKFEDSRDTLL